MLKSQHSDPQPSSAESCPLAHSDSTPTPSQHRLTPPSVVGTALPSSPTTRPRPALTGSQKMMDIHPMLDTTFTQVDSSPHAITMDHLSGNLAYQTIQKAPDLFAMKILERFNDSQQPVSFKVPAHLDQVMSHSPRSTDKLKPGFYLAQISQSTYNDIGNFALSCLAFINTVHTDFAPIYPNSQRLLKHAIKNELRTYLMTNAISNKTKEDLKSNEKFASYCPGALLISVDINELLSTNTSPAQYCYNRVTQDPSLYGQNIQIKVTGKTVAVFFKWIQSHLIRYFFAKLLPAQTQTRSTNAEPAFTSQLTAPSRHQQPPTLTAHDETLQINNTSLASTLAATPNSNLNHLATDHTNPLQLTSSSNLRTCSGLHLNNSTFKNNSSTLFYNRGAAARDSRSAFSKATRTQSLLPGRMTSY